MKTNNERRLEDKINLFETKGFFLFLKDLQKEISPNLDLVKLSNMIKLDYLEELEKEKTKNNKYVQKKINFYDK